jgi:5-methylcytosine-specific restriction endonuclease McrA
MIENEENFYYKNKSKPDIGFVAACKVCTKINVDDWKARNPEKWKEIYMYHNNNPSPELLELKKFHSNNRREDYYKEYFEKYPDKQRQYREDKDQHRTHIIDLREWEDCKLYFNYRCGYCGMKWEEHKEEYGQDLHKEHVIHGGLNDLSNCIPACKICNSHKWMFPLEDWYNENNISFSGERLEKIKKWLSEDYKLYIRNYDTKDN